MIGFLLRNWKAIAICLAVFALLAYIQTIRVERDFARSELASFKQKVAEAAQTAAEAALKKTVADEQRKEAADAENAKLADANAALVKRLRDARANRNILSPATPDSASPSLACLDRSEYIGAYRDLVTEIRGAGDEGTKAVIDLDTAKAWVRGR